MQIYFLIHSFIHCAKSTTLCIVKPVAPHYAAKIKMQTCARLNCFYSHNSDSPMPVTSRVCFVKFQEPESVGVSQHLTNTVFVDRALIVVPFAEGLSFCDSFV